MWSNEATIVDGDRNWKLENGEKLAPLFGLRIHSLSLYIHFPQIRIVILIA